MTNPPLDQNFEEISQEKPKVNKLLLFSRIREKIPTILPIFLAGVILITVIFITNKAVRVKRQTETPTPTPSITSSPEQFRSASRYATDAATLKIKDEVESIEKPFKNTDLNEAGLNPPILDWGLKLE